MDGVEQWRPVSGYEGRYEVSDLGRVRSLDRVSISPEGTRRRVKGRLLAQRLTGGKDSERRYAVWLYAGGKASARKVHRLVAIAFVPGAADHLEVCHNDGDYRNNSAANLRWDTRSSNAQDAVLHGTHYYASREACSRGHEYSEENTQYLGPGNATRRRCRVCRRKKPERKDASAKMLAGEEVDL